MSSDDEMELLRQKRALELRRKMLLSQQHRQQQQQPKTEPSVQPVKTDASQVVKKLLTGRGIEVLETARRRYPAEVREIEKGLAEMVESGRLKGPISGEQLYLFLRRIGLPFTMDVKIRVKEHGELKTLGEKFRTSNSP
jgi:DNA-binding TFAR19-related protein (PDSD5 family)